MSINDAIQLVLEGQDPREVLEFILLPQHKSKGQKARNNQNVIPKTASNNMEVPSKSPLMKATDDLAFGLDANKEKLQDIAPPQDIANQGGGTTYPYGNKHHE